jgi:DNA-directed RNA polymerase II subunit RPB7
MLHSTARHSTAFTGEPSRSSEQHSPMFFIKDLSLNLTLHPSFFGAQMNDYLRQKLLTDVEGTCTGQFGYIVCVLESSNIDVGKGRVIPGNNGYAEFEVRYKAVVWKPFKGEVVDGIVNSVNSMGFFADVGPLSVFVSKHLIPSDMKYNPSHTPPAYIGEDQLVTKNSRVRIKVIGTRSDVNSISVIGSIKEDYLGPL